MACLSDQCSVETPSLSSGETRCGSCFHRLPSLTLTFRRTALQLAEIEREGGFSPRISPMTSMSSRLDRPGARVHSASPDSQSVTSLLNRAGFSLSTVDVDEVQIRYPSIYELVEDLKWMGEGNAVINRFVLPPSHFPL